MKAVNPVHRKKITEDHDMADFIRIRSLSIVIDEGDQDS